jgi:pimeloyl-ACP methyl ester carboxylesterase
LQLAASYPELARSMVLLEPAFPYAPDEPKSDPMPNAIAAAKDGDLGRAFDSFPDASAAPAIEMSSSVRWARRATKTNHNKANA